MERRLLFLTGHRAKGIALEKVSESCKRDGQLFIFPLHTMPTHKQLFEEIKNGKDEVVRKIQTFFYQDVSLTFAATELWAESPAGCYRTMHYTNILQREF